MKINPEINKILKEYNIIEADGISYLLGIYFGYDSELFTVHFRQLMNLTKIVVPDNTGLKWNVPLFLGQETAFAWVKEEYVPLFSQKNSARGGKVREATARMKRLFAANPEIRKEDVLGATIMYLMNTDPDYIRYPHYFIEKGKGGEKTQDILDWIEKFKLSEQMGQGRTGKENVMQ